MPRCPFLSDCAERLDAAAEAFEELVVDMRPDQAVWKPSAKTWSVAEGIDHVNVSARLYFDRVRPAIARGRSAGLTGAAPYGRGTFLGRMILRVLEPGAGRKFPAPKRFRPAASDLDFTAVKNDFRAVHATLADLMEEADGLDLGRIRFTTPAGPILKVTLAEAFAIHSYHVPRHLAQAERVTRTESYPAC